MTSTAPTTQTDPITSRIHTNGPTMNIPPVSVWTSAVSDRRSCLANAVLDSCAVEQK